MMEYLKTFWVNFNARPTDTLIACCLGFLVIGVICINEAVRLYRHERELDRLRKINGWIDEQPWTTRRRTR